MKSIYAISPAMKIFLGLFLICFAFAGFGFSQKSRSNQIAANAKWQSFYTSFLAAVKKRDKETMLQMMPKGFFDGGGGGTATAREWLKMIDDTAKQRSWQDLQKSFSQGTVINRNWSSKGTPIRVTKDNSYFFEFRKDNKWYFAGVVGD